MTFPSSGGGASSAQAPMPGTLLASVEDWSGTATVMTAGGAAIYGFGISVPPPSWYGFKRNKVVIRYHAPIGITAAGNGALALAVEEFTSAAATIVDSEQSGQGFLFGANSRNTNIPDGEYLVPGDFGNVPRQFALYAFLLVDAAGLTASVRSLAVPPPKSWMRAYAA